MKKVAFSILVMFIYLVSCSKNEQTNLDQYLTHSDKFEKKKVINPNENFSLFIPVGWEFDSVDFNDRTENNHILAWSSIYPKDAELFNHDRIEIIKAKDSLGLKEQYERYISKIDSLDNIIDSGETNFLKYSSYFTHTSHKEYYGRGAIGEREIIRFSLKSKQEGIYYYLFLIALKNENQNQNMSTMLHSLKTFEILE